jgi:hypothetical protein
MHPNKLREDQPVGPTHLTASQYRQLRVRMRKIRARHMRTTQTLIVNAAGWGSVPADLLSIRVDAHDEQDC